MSESSRFQHLLQPIRDLGKNWNIDLAHELEEYLDELEHLSIAFDAVRGDGDGDDTHGGGHSQSLASPSASPLSSSFLSTTSSSSSSQQGGANVMNFAEAALLIQGTSMIYSRKVEYLYALVFQTLAHLSRQQEQQQGHPTAGASLTMAGAPMEDADGNAPLDVLADPLPTYQDLPQAKHGAITLKKRTATNNSRAAANRRHAAVKTKNNIQASIALMGSLVPDERDHGESLKLRSCLLLPSGVMLLDEASNKFLTASSSSPTAAAASSWGWASPVGRRQPTRLVQTPLSKLQFDRQQGDDGDADRRGDGEDDDEDDDNDQGYDMFDEAFGGDDNAGDGGEPLPIDQDQQEYDHFDDGDQDLAMHGHEQVMPDGSAVKHEAMRTAGMNALGSDEIEHEDPWAPLDAYDASKATVRPFRKGRSFPVRGARARAQKREALDTMDGVDDPDFKARFLLGLQGGKDEGSSDVKPQWASWVWTDVNQYDPAKPEKESKRLVHRFRKSYCRTPALAVSCESLWKLERKWSRLTKRAEVRATQQDSANAILWREQEDEELQQEEHDHGTLLPDLSSVDAADHDSGPYDGDGDDDDDGDVGDNGGFDYDGGDADDDGGQRGIGDESTLSFPQTLSSQSQSKQTYEDLCRTHLADFMKGTELYMRETDLTRKVNDWQDKLAPLLQAQDARPPFDIHRYGREIIDSLQERTPPLDPSTSARRKRTTASDTDNDSRDSASVAFGGIVEGRSSFEVCRLFLASLQLANNGNVRLVHGHSAAEQRVMPLKMELLSTEDAYEVLQPSTQPSSPLVR